MLQKRIPDVASPRILRWLIMLGGYQFTVEHRSAAKHRNCDALSRCPDSRPVCDQPESEFEKEIVRSVYFLSPGPLADTQMTLPEALAPGEVARATAADAVLRKVLHWVRKGWPKRCPGEKFAPYFRKRTGLSIIRDCLMFGTRVVLPDSFIPIVRQMFIDLHVGVEKCQALGRLYFWFPSLPDVIQDAVASCEACQQTRPNPPRDAEAISLWFSTQVRVGSRATG